MRNVTVLDCAQRSPDWYAARCGRLTGSVAGEMLAQIKSGEAAARRDLRMQLVVERLTGLPQDDSYINAAMQRGIDLEPAAFAAYEALTGQLAQRCGFLRHDLLFAGCSPDGYLDDFRVLVSLKCPKSATHLRYLRTGGIPAEHVPQMLHELWISGAEFYDFLSFDDRFPPSMQTFYVRVPRDEDQVTDYAKKAIAFLAEVDREVEVICTLNNLREQLTAAVTA